MERWEDDVETEQQWKDAFRANPAVKVTRMNGNGSSSTATAKPKSKFALQMEQKRQQQQGAKSFTVDLDAAQREPRQAMPIAGLMNEVQERPSATSSTFTPIPQATGFPLPKRRSLSPEPGPSRLSVAEPAADTLEPSSEEDYARQNEDRLAQMSPAEIVEEQQEVREMLDEKTIAFLMSRRKGKQKEVPLEDPPNAQDVSHTVPASSSTATFDRLGNRTSSTLSAEDSHAHDHLHAQAETYSLPALISMTRSSVPQQRSFALSLLQRIITKHSSRPEVLALAPALAEICSSLMTTSHLSTRTSAVTLAASASDIPGFSSAIQDLKPGIFVILSHVLESDPEPSQIVLTALCTIITSLDPEKIAQHLLLIERLQTLCLAVPWPNGNPNPAFLDILSLMIRHSRTTAQLVLSDLASLQVLSRYLAIPFWQLNEPLGALMTAKTIDLLSLLGHYGIACQYRTTLASCWAAYLSHTFTSSEEVVAVSWVRLARVWMTCAVNPHQTDPEHAVSWSQISEWGEKVVDIAKVQWSEGGGMQSEVWKCLSVWKLGSVRYGTPHELEMSIEERLEQAAKDLLAGQKTQDLLIAGLGLAQACGIKSIDKEIAKTVFAQQAGSMHKPTAQDIALLVALLPYLGDTMAAKLFIISIAGSLETTAVNKIVRQVLEELSPSSARLPVKDILSPFLTAAVPTSPSYMLKPTEISLITTLDSSDKANMPVWPLSTPLHELLHSAESKVLRALPDNWNFGEVEIVVAGLVLLLYSIDKLQAAAKSDAFYLIALPTANQVQLQLMNIFLLEQVDARMVTSSEAVFRDPQITHLASQALTSTSSLSQPLAVDPQFYQIYTDFLGLYDSMSLGHPVFSALLLPPVLDIKNYPVDFRRLLFVDYGHVLRTIESPLPTGFSFADTPVEDNDTLLGSYLAAMVQRKVVPEKNPALYMFCSYHVKGAATSNATWAKTIRTELGQESWACI